MNDSGTIAGIFIAAGGVLILALAAGILWFSHRHPGAPRTKCARCGLCPPDYPNTICPGCAAKAKRD